MELADVTEQTRVYHYPDKSTVRIEDIIGFKDSKTTHRLKDLHGHLHIVNKGWNHIVITGAEDFVL